MPWTESMELINNTPFVFAPLAGRINFPGYSLTCIVKGTFDLHMDAPVTIAKEQLLVCGDEFYEDDEESRGAPRYDSDFAYLKPHTDLMLVGHCYTPEKKPVVQIPVKFGVGEHVQTLTVLGEREWRRQLLSWKATEPQAFNKLPLRYEHAFGGAGDQYNPIGQGHAQMLPRIEFPNEPITSPNDRPLPAGFGPYARAWQYRQEKLGSYKRDYRDTRWPWFAEDMDWRYFNAAPPSGQLAAYLNGNEPLYFENLHPQHSRYRSQLPGIKPRLFTAVASKLNEVQLNLDTLWVDMDNAQLVLLWRGWQVVQTPEYDELSHIYIELENQGNGARRLADWQNQFEEITKEQSVEAKKKVKFEERIDEEVEAALKQAESGNRQQLIAAGLNPDKLPEQTQEERAFEAEVLAAIGEGVDADAEKMTREHVLAAYGAGASFANCDLSGLDLSLCNLQGADFSGAQMRETNLAHSVLTNCNFTGSKLLGARLQGAHMEKTVLHGADLSGAILVSTDLKYAQMADAVLDQADLSGACLYEVNGHGALFTRVKMQDADLRKAQLTEADFSGALLDRSNFSESLMHQAVFNHVSAHECDFSHAVLTELRCSENADLKGSRFQGITAQDAIWEGVNAQHCDFRYAQLQGALFSSSLLQNSDFSAADLSHSNLSKADLSQCRAVQANFFQASLEQACLKSCDFSGSNLYGAEFYNAQFEQCCFEGANLAMTKLQSGIGA